MIPELSTLAQAAAFITRTRRRAVPLVDFEMGGVAIGDAAQGLNVKLWQSAYEDGSIKVGPVDGELTSVISVAGVLRTALAFDQNMRMHLGYTVGGNSYLYWYDTSTNSMATMTLTGVTDICLCLDDHRTLTSSGSDILVSYSRNRRLYCRVQRDRFQTERQLTTGDMGGDQLVAAAMTTVNRVGWRILPTDA